MRFKGLMDCDERFTKAFEVAILHYDRAGNGEPEKIPTYDNSFHSGFVNKTLIINNNNLFYFLAVVVFD